MSTASQQALVARLRANLGETAVLTGADVSARQVGIWDERPLQALAIVRPQNTAELAEVMRLCHAAGQTVVTHGGRTGLVEGCVAGPGDLVISLERMNRIENIDHAGRCMTLEAGVVLELAQRAAADEGFMLPLDLGARGSCTIGGNIATNAGGNRVIRYGMTRDMVLGLEAVLADGTVISSLNSMLKNNAGYDLKQLFIGTEGTLGIVTRAVLRLRPAFRSESTAFVACSSFSQVQHLLAFLERELGGQLSAFECLWQGFYAQASKHLKAPLESGSSHYVLLESLGADPERDTERFTAVLAAAADAGLLTDAVIAKSGAERDSFWAIRDNVEACLTFGEYFIFDVSLPLAAMPEYVADVLARLDAAVPEHRSFVFGHVGDGNLHFVISPQAAGARGLAEASVYEPLQKVGGSVSAEHGIGLEKKFWLCLSRSNAEIRLMQTLKHALDPQGLLNPGKIFDAPDGAGLQ
jgi:FAD/FMN-containing dehydrogenase